MFSLATVRDMAQVIVRNLDDEVVSSLKFKAELHGHSLEQEAKDARLVTADRRLAQRLAGTPWQARTTTLWSWRQEGTRRDVTRRATVAAGAGGTNPTRDLPLTSRRAGRPDLTP